jgi:hypothetical protein
VFDAPKAPKDSILRVEFSGFPETFSPTLVGVNSGTEVQFVKAPATNVNLGITNLSINNTTLGQDPSGSENGQTVLFYGKGKSEIDISPFDNFYKFTVVTNPSGNSPKAFNFDTGGSYYLQFIDNNGKKLSVPNLTNTNIANPSKGELAFKIDETYSTKILQFVDRTFYITNRPPKSDEEAQLSDTTVATNSSIQDVRATTSISNNLPLNSIFGIGASSVVYWGYWKPEKEESRFIGATGATASTGTPRTNTNVVRGGTVGPTPAAQPDGVNLLTNVKPIAGPTGTFRRFGIPVQRIDQINLTLDEKINAVSSAVQGFVDQGWTTTRIISYFLKPNEVGYKLFQLSKDQFKQAVVGIFSDADLVLIDNFGNTQSGLTNGGPASTKGRVTQTGGGNIGSDISNRVTRGGRQL